MSAPSSPPRPPCVPCRLAAIGAVVAVLAGGFAYVGGWLTPSRLSAPRVIDQFQQNAGVHPGFRRNHAKGVCVSGEFESNGNGMTVSRAALFAPNVTTPVIGRFAIPGSNPSAPDASVPIRSFALMYRLANGEQWRTGMNSTPLFAVHTPAQFYAQLQASQPDPATGKPDPAKMKAFLDSNPETLPLRQWMAAHKASSSFTNAAYYSINAFRFTNEEGQTQAVRWSVVPETPYAPVTAQQNAEPDFLSRDLEARLQNGGTVRWHLVLTVANPGDPTDDATLQWPADRRQIDAGTLTIRHATPQAEGLCRDVNFDPTILPDGIAPSDDPLLAARSAAYSVSYNRRVREEARRGMQTVPSNPPAHGDRS